MTSEKYEMIADAKDSAGQAQAAGASAQAAGAGLGGPDAGRGRERAGRGRRPRPAPRRTRRGSLSRRRRRRARRRRGPRARRSRTQSRPPPPQGEEIRFRSDAHTKPVLSNGHLPSTLLIEEISQCLTSSLLIFRPYHVWGTGIRKTNLSPGTFVDMPKWKSHSRLP
jgi:hypothetical protein